MSDTAIILPPQWERNTRLSETVGELERRGKLTKREKNELKIADELTSPAFRRTCSIMRRHGNSLSADHKKALFRMVGMFGRMAAGFVKKRVAMDLACGAGKTSAVIAWSTELVNSGLPYSCIVAASRVEDLCSIRDGLVREGVAESEIGLVHSYGRQRHPDGTLKARYPATDNNSERRILLVTHSRIRGLLTAKHTKFCGRPRSLVIFDESLLTTEHRAVSEMNLAKGVFDFSAIARVVPLEGDQKAAHEYLRACWDIVEKEKARQKQYPSSKARALNFPAREPDDIDAYIRALPDSERREDLEAFLKIAHDQRSVRYVSTSQSGGGIIKYDVVVDPALKTVAVLDASYTIRELVRLDKTITKDQGWYGKIKRYDNVSLNFLKHGSGRASMLKEFSRPKDERTISKEVIAVLQTLPDTEPVVLFTFKHRGGNEAHIAKKFKADMSAAGLDSNQALPDGSPRFHFVTWGKETAANTWASCRHVIFLGVLQRSDVDLAGAYCAQSDDLTGDVKQDDVLRVRRSEVVHMVYQAMNRAIIRVTNQGQAERGNVWLFHWDTGVCDELANIMPGLKICEWKPVAGLKASIDSDVIAKWIVEYLDSVPTDTATMSIRQLKVAAALTEVPSSTFRLARDKALDGGGWKLKGRSVVRTV